MWKSYMRSDVLYRASNRETIAGTKTLLEIVIQFSSPHNPNILQNMLSKVPAVQLLVNDVSNYDRYPLNFDFLDIHKKGTDLYIYPKVTFEDKVLIFEADELNQCVRTIERDMYSEIIKQILESYGTRTYLWACIGKGGI